MENRAEIPPGHFKCDHCGEVFPKGWSDEDAMQEALHNFGGLVGDDDGLFCDDCYAEFMKWLAERQ